MDGLDWMGWIGLDWIGLDWVSDIYINIYIYMACYDRFIFSGLAAHFFPN